LRSIAREFGLGGVFFSTATSKVPEQVAELCSTPAFAARSPAVVSITGKEGEWRG